MNLKKTETIFKCILSIVSITLGCALLATALRLLENNKEEPGIIREYGFENLKKAYPNWQENDLYELLKETSDWPMVYEPFTCMAHAEKKGRFINHDGNLRNSGIDNYESTQNKKTIWIFGGSTALGAGSPDWNTIPALIQKNISNKVYRVINYGRGFYFSTQEKILFLQLLEKNPSPEFAIFLHGLNDFHFGTGAPEFTDQINKVFLRGDKINKKVSPGKEKNIKTQAEDVLQRLKVNREQINAVCKEKNIMYLEVIQPVPLYDYPSDLFIFNSQKHNFGRHYLHKLGYQLLNQKHEYCFKSKNILNLSSLLKNSQKISYCDAVHYTEETNNLIAEAIVSHLTKYYTGF